MNSNLNFLFALLIVVAIASFSLAVRSCGAPAIPPAFSELTTIESAIARSRETKRPVLAFFTADWCGECQKFKRGALSSSRVTRWIEENVEAVYIDASKANSGDAEMMRTLTRYRVTAVPTLLMLEPGREFDERARLEGNARRRDLLEWLQKINPAK